METEWTRNERVPANEIVIVAGRRLVVLHRHNSMTHMRIHRIHIALCTLGLLAASAGWWPGEAAGVPRVGGQSVVLRSGAHEFAVSLRCPRFLLDGGVAGGALPLRVKGGLSGGHQLEVSYPPQAAGTNGLLEARLRLGWAAAEGVLYKWAEFRLKHAPSPVLLEEVVLEEAELPRETPQLEGSGVQSYPAFWRGFFAGIEFPVAATRIEGQRLIVAHRPGWTLQNGEWRQSRKAVFGVAPERSERNAFGRYITARRPKPAGLHVNYNSWWTSPAPFYKESDILTLMEQFERKLYKPHGVSFDTFCIDMGWAEPRSVWRIKKDLFPEGFVHIQSAAAKMNCRLGLWISPTACYHDALNPDWARANLETFKAGGQGMQMCCLAGDRYATAFREQLVALVRRYDIRHVKLDGYYLECLETTHGHAPGTLSAEAIAEGGIAAFAAVRQAQPEVWLESTCFGWNPSPWWLLHVNSVIGTFGDDAPRGRVPAPVYRESYTTARDYFNLQGAARMSVPIVAQEVLGVIHQTSEPFMNDAVITALRGHAFLPLYVNPLYLDESRWKALAQFLQWSRRNAPLLAETTPILPAAWREGRAPHFSNDEEMPREPYGYAHWRRGQGLVALRNPWVRPQTLALRLDESIGVESRAKNLEVVSLYPEPRLYGSEARFGETLQVPLAPYETLVLSLARKQVSRGLPHASEVLNRSVSVRNANHNLSRLEFEGPEPSLADSSSPMTTGTSAFQLELNAEADITSPTAELLVLTEAGKPVPEAVQSSFTVDGQAVALTSSSSATGWAATGQPVKEHWLFLRGPVPGGQHRLSLKMAWEGAPIRVSAWLWATKPGGSLPAYANALPSPETISLDARALFEPLNSGSASTIRGPRPVEHIDGIFLDALEPVSCVQGWGTLQKNQSVWEKPMTIAGRRFRRGVGTHADSRIVYNTGGRYRRFQSWVGADGASNATITFEVWADGQKRWASGLMNRQSPARRVDMEITGAKIIELVVGHGEDNITSDHANWADAKLLR